MKTLYQQIRWNVVYEVLEDRDGNVFIFKNCKFWKAAENLEAAIFIIKGRQNNVYKINS